MTYGDYSNKDLFKIKQLKNDFKQVLFLQGRKIGSIDIVDKMGYQDAIDINVDRLYNRAFNIDTPVLRYFERRVLKSGIETLSYTVDMTMANCLVFSKQTKEV